MKSVRLVRLFVSLIVILFLASIAYAYTASNTVPTNRAGYGSATISGYVVENVSYNLSTSDPRNIDSVSLSLDAAASTVKIKLDSTGATYYDCTNTAGYNWSCDVGGAVTITEANELQVIAAQ
ncbi:MAG TPA: hypothetical protein VGA03_13695 [Anaerolineales bacterium]